MYFKNAGIFLNNFIDIIIYDWLFLILKIFHSSLLFSKAF